MLAPINLNDPEAFMSQLSNAEQSCISENGDPPATADADGRPWPLALALAHHRMPKS